MASTEVLIRRPQSQEHHAVRALVTAVANETFANLFAPNPVPLKLDEEDWSLCWVAVCDSKIVGVLLTNQEWVSDLWVLRENRRHGIGRKLLALGESEIAARGHQTCRLRSREVEHRGRRILFSSGLVHCARIPP